ncbi:hypothetical protein [Magnetofaba australis]|uniref:hypothetical protein n=1 Tax=Magnetofaba australis TaxID=1472297 RepID=UPI000A19C890|nr:hypothetical protein [Magnetofaba australis]
MSEFWNRPTWQNPQEEMTRGPDGMWRPRSENEALVAQQHAQVEAPQEAQPQSLQQSISGMMNQVAMKMGVHPSQGPEHDLTPHYYERFGDTERVGEPAAPTAQPISTSQADAAPPAPQPFAGLSSASPAHDQTGLPFQSAAAQGVDPASVVMPALGQQAPGAGSIWAPPTQAVATSQLQQQPVPMQSPASQRGLFPKPALLPFQREMRGLPPESEVSDATDQNSYKSSVPQTNIEENAIPRKSTGNPQQDAYNRALDRCPDAPPIQRERASAGGPFVCKVNPSDL